MNHKNHRPGAGDPDRLDDRDEHRESPSQEGRGAAHVNEEDEVRASGRTGGAGEPGDVAGSAKVAGSAGPATGSAEGAKAAEAAGPSESSESAEAAVTAARTAAESAEGVEPEADRETGASGEPAPPREQGRAALLKVVRDTGDNQPPRNTGTLAGDIGDILSDSDPPRGAGSGPDPAGLAGLTRLRGIVRNDPAGESPDAVDLDEEALRQLLRGAVDSLQPRTDALDHLRRAVPARRTRRRQAIVGAAAALVLGGAALPALVHVATAGGASNDRPGIAASSKRTSDAHGGAHSGGGHNEKGDDSPHHDDEDHEGKHKHGKDDESKGANGDSGGPDSDDPTSTPNTTSPLCTRVQLGNSSAQAGTADAEGRIAGSFRVVNISADACTVDGGGVVSAAAQGGADASRVTVVDHTSGDAASGLPDPSTYPGVLILQPGQAYEVKFVWVPAAGGGTSGCSTGGASPTADPTQGSTTVAPEGEPTTGGSGGTGGEPVDASVLLTHTPAAGDPAAAGTTLVGACAGTVYRTGILVG